MSIYLPDDLAELLKTAGTGESTSQVIQEALRRHFGESSGATYARVPTDAPRLIEQARNRLMPMAQQEYEDGFAAALKRAADLPWEVFDELDAHHFDIAAWIRPVTRAAHSAVCEQTSPSTAGPEWLSLLAEDLGQLADPIGFDRFSFRRSSMYLRGYGDALRQVFVAVLQHHSDNAEVHG
ncbi:ribbon-helix-helix domain-containing protein [Nocardia sp. NPDC004711]